MGLIRTARIIGSVLLRTPLAGSYTLCSSPRSLGQSKTRATSARSPIYLFLSRSCRITTIAPLTVRRIYRETLVTEHYLAVVFCGGEESVHMGELTQAEVYSPRTQQVWRALLSWLAAFFQIFFQIIRALGHYPLLSLSSSTPSFKPLPTVELQEPDLPPASAVDITAAEYSGANDQPVQKLTVVLDLDETLVCAYETSSLPAALRTQAIEAGLNWFELECISSDKEGDGKPKVNYVTVFERPGLKEFLKQLSEFADLVLFTAGLEGYAKPLVDRIDMENLFSLRLYRPSTTSTQYREHVKDLSGISKDLCRIVIVDNNPFSFLLQPLNGIPCIPFSGGQPYDTQLLDVILPLLKHLSEQKDVRPVIYEKYHMPEWFQKQGIPASCWTF